MANMLVPIAFEIKAGAMTSGIVDLTQYAPVALYALRFPDGGNLMPVGAPRLATENERGNVPLDLYPIGDDNGPALLAFGQWQGPAAVVPMMLPVPEWMRTIPHLAFLACDDNGKPIAQAEDTLIYAVCEIRR